MKEFSEHCGRVGELREVVVSVRVNEGEEATL